MTTNVPRLERLGPGFFKVCWRQSDGEGAVLIDCDRGHLATVDEWQLGLGPVPIQTLADVAQPEAVRLLFEPAESGESVACKIGRATVDVAESILGDAELQCLLERILRGWVLHSCMGRRRRSSDVCPTSRSTPLDVYRVFSRGIARMGLSARLTREASRWVSDAAVTASMRRESGADGSLVSPVVSLFDLLALTAARETQLNDIERIMRDHRLGSSESDEQLREAFWDLAACELWCREILTTLAGSADKEKRPRLLQLVRPSQLLQFWNVKRQLCRLQCELWQRPAAREALSAELRLMDCSHPRDARQRCIDFFCLNVLDGSDVIESRTAFLAWLKDLVPRERLSDPFGDGLKRDAFERASARWFDQTAQRRLTNWEQETGCSSSHGSLTRQRDGAPDWPRSHLQLLRSAIDRYPVTTVSLFAMACSLAPALVGGFNALARVGAWPTAWLYTLVQATLLSLWVWRGEQRRFVPRSFFGTAFIWLILLFPLLEIAHKTRRLVPGAVSEREQDNEYFLLSTQAGWPIVLVSLAGVLLCLGLIMLQVRGRTKRGHTREPNNINWHRPQIAWRRFQSEVNLRGIWVETTIACKATAFSVVGSLWWGTTVFTAFAALDLLPLHAEVDVRWVIFPLSIWAVAIAFLSQLMWQDQFLTEPMSHDA